MDASGLNVVLLKVLPKAYTVTSNNNKHNYKVLYFGCIKRTTMQNNVKLYNPHLNVVLVTHILKFLSCCVRPKNRHY